MTCSATSRRCGVSPVLDEIDALPCSQNQRAGDDGNGELGLRQRRANMRRHVVRPFRVMGVARSLRRDLREEGLEVLEHRRIGVFLDQQRRGGMAAEDRQQPLVEALGPDEIRSARV